MAYGDGALSTFISSSPGVDLSCLFVSAIPPSFSTKMVVGNSQRTSFCIGPRILTQWPRPAHDIFRWSPVCTNIRKNAFPCAGIVWACALWKLYFYLGFRGLFLSWHCYDVITLLALAYRRARLHGKLKKRQQNHRRGGFYFEEKVLLDI